MAPVPADDAFGGVVLVGVHGLLQFLQIALRVHAVDVAVERAHPLKIAVAVCVGVADDKGAVPAEDEGVDMVIVLLQREGVAEVGGGQAGHQSNAGPAVFHGI